MIILTIRSDEPEAELSLYNDKEQIDKIIWKAHRQLAETINTKIKKLLELNHCELKNLGGIVCYKGPGSFTGLRIGLTVANTFAQQLNIPIIGGTGKGWENNSIKKILMKENEELVIPVYGGEPHITQQKK